jgi:hypothetical protein
MITAMKTTIEVSDQLYRGVKAPATLRGGKLKDPVEEGLRLVLEAPATRRPSSRVRLMKYARGTFESGISDLASNPAHLAGFGRDARRDL